MSLKIKVCGMRDPHNIRQLQEIVKPDFIGFIFYPLSKRYAGELKADFPDGAVFGETDKVGVFVNASMDEIIEVTQWLNPGFIQLHGDESPEFCKQVKERGFRVIKAFQVSDRLPSDLNAYMGSVDFFLFDTKSEGYGGSGKKFDWAILEEYDNRVPLFLSGGIGPDEVRDVIKLSKNLNIAVVDINSRFESEPGLKNIDQIKQFKNILSNELYD